MTKPTQAEITLAAMRAAGARGITALELFEAHGISRPSAIADELARYGHVVDREQVRLDSFERTIRYTLVHDATPQLALT